MKPDETLLYLCDPEKNTECNKRGCIYKHSLGECYSTTNKGFARSDVPFAYRIEARGKGLYAVFERVTQ